MTRQILRIWKTNEKDKLKLVHAFPSRRFNDAGNEAILRLKT